MGGSRGGRLTLAYRIITKAVFASLLLHRCFFIGLKEESWEAPLLKAKGSFEILSNVKISQNNTYVHLSCIETQLSNKLYFDAFFKLTESLFLLKFTKI